MNTDKPKNADKKMDAAYWKRYLLRRLPGYWERKGRRKLLTEYSLLFAAIATVVTQIEQEKANSEPVAADGKQQTAEVA